ncbi:hypothetical protein BHM03_00044977 [Ensete ventricosum]|nr:hypothetical protein BHM03_00044977 [Ensete ventricosum]
MHRTGASSTTDRQVRRSSFHVQLLPSLLLPCAASSIVEIEDRSFLCHQRTHLKLPPPTMSSSTVSTVIAFPI